MGEERGGRWSHRSDPARFWRTLAVALVVAIGVGLIGGTLVDKATGVEPSRRCATDTGSPCTTPTAHDKRFARKYRSGYVRHAHGFDPHKVFKHPRAARHIIVRRIARAIDNAQRHGRTVTYRKAGREVTCPSTGGRQCAWEMYAELMRKAGCTGWGDTDINHRACLDLMAPSTRPLTKRDVQIGASAGLCGADVVVGIATTTATSGTTAIIASTAATACIISFWSMVDPG